MKIKEPVSGIIENVKINSRPLKGTKGFKYFVVINEEEFDSRDILMLDYEIVEIDRMEMRDFNNFLISAKFQLWETSDFFDGKMEAWREIEKNRGKDEEKGNDE